MPVRLGIYGDRGHQRKFSCNRERYRDEAIKLDATEAQTMPVIRKLLSNMEITAEEKDFLLSQFGADDAATLNKIISKKDIAAEDRDFLLSQFGPAEAFKFAENCVVFKTVAQLSQPSGWISQLEQSNDFSEKIIAANGLEVSLYDHYVGDYIFERYLQERDKYNKAIEEYEPGTLAPNAQPYLFWLEEGCKHKLMLALQESCLLKIENIKNVKSDAAEREYSSKFDENLEIMSKLYMTMGYMCAARLCFELASYFEKEKAFGVSLNYYVKAADYFFGGQALAGMDLPEDKHLRDVIGQGEDLKPFGFESMDSAKQIIMDKLYALAMKVDGGAEILHLNAQDNVMRMNITKIKNAAAEAYATEAKKSIVMEVMARKERILAAAGMTGIAGNTEAWQKFQEYNKMLTRPG